MLLGLLLLTAGAVIWRDALLDRTYRYTPQSAAAMSQLYFSDADAGGSTTVQGLGPMSWRCDLGSVNPYPYCGYELFLDRKRGLHGLDLRNMKFMRVTLLYQGAATSFRVHLKNFDPRYADRADDETPQYLRVEADTTPGREQSVSFTRDDFGVADWWLRKRKLPPQFGRPQFNDITSLIIETGSEAAPGPHSFAVRSLTIRTAIMSEAEWYSLLLGVWSVIILLYLGYRIGNLRRALSDRRRLEALALQEAQEAARRDHLTGLLNRRGLTEKFDALIRRRSRAFALAIIMIDIDHFKALNDQYGHKAGDHVLSDFATILADNVRSVDIAARWGGEEFLLVCADVTRRGAQVIAEKLRQCVQDHDFSGVGRVTASFGVHWAQGAAHELTHMTACADKALYAAKAEGRNACRMYRLEAADAKTETLARSRRQSG